MVREFSEEQHFSNIKTCKAEEGAKMLHFQGLCGGTWNLSRTLWFWSSLKNREQLAITSELIMVSKAVWKNEDVPGQKALGVRGSDMNCWKK